MEANITQGAILKADTSRLSAALELDQNDAHREIQLLLSVTLDSSRALISACSERVVETEKYTRYQSLFERRMSGEPIAYLLGRKEFYGIEFRVNPSVLIPRPETELVVEHVLERIIENKRARVLDLGTGSGIIAIILAKLRPQINVTAVDICPSALSLARENAHNLEVGNVSFSHSDWYENMSGETFDLIVSNPPYVADDAPHLHCGDLRSEPSRALMGGKGGLECIRTIVSQASKHLNPAGWIILEHGYDQTHAVQAELSAAGFDKIRTYDDLAGIPRVTEGQLVTE